MIATKPVDFRKGHDGLAAVVEQELGLKAHSGIDVVFRAKRADRIKILVWDGSGLVMTYKRLEDGKFAWPTISDGVMRVSKGSSRPCSKAWTGDASMPVGCAHLLPFPGMQDTLPGNGRSESSRRSRRVWLCIPCIIQAMSREPNTLDLSSLPPEALALIVKHAT